MKIKDILSTKGFTVVGIDPKKTLKDALSTMVEKRVGALLVRGENGALEGIITERDIMRAVHDEMPLDESPVGDVMTRDVVTGSPEDHVEYAMNEMTEKRFRHMPIVEGDNLLGVLSSVTSGNGECHCWHVEKLIEQVAALERLTSLLEERLWIEHIDARLSIHLP